MSSRGILITGHTIKDVNIDTHECETYRKINILEDVNLTLNLPALPRGNRDSNTHMARYII